MSKTPLIIVTTVLGRLFRARRQIRIDPRALRIVDGDTVALAGQRHRLVGFNAPEITHPASAQER
jgi:endonuclease YncB( thermonuclease family)